MIGSVQAASALKQNAARRAGIQTLMVHLAVRRRGIARVLMGAAEALTLNQARTPLSLGTSTGSETERLYHALGYLRVGVIPRDTVEADGAEHATTRFYTSPRGAPDV